MLPLLKNEFFGLYVIWIAQRSYVSIFVQFCGWVTHFPRRNWLYFNGDRKSCGLWITIQNCRFFSLGSRPLCDDLQHITASCKHVLV